MARTVFVDGQHGTTGLKIHERLRAREDIELIDIPVDKRRDLGERRKHLNEADIVFLCLPDDAAREAVSMVINPAVCIIDASTAHRTAKGWVYGLPELNREQRSLIRASNRISVPGCHATGFVLLLYPLVSGGIVGRDYPVSAHSVSGYSGGGKAMIAQYQAANLTEDIRNPRPYALDLNHKHVREMQKIPNLAFPPIFAPTVANFYNGEVVSIPLFPRLLGQPLTARQVTEFYAEYYAGEKFIRVRPYPADGCLKDGFLTLTDCNDTNIVEIFVFGNDDRIVLSARFDNLGKGSSGAAVQDMNLRMGVAEDEGL
jgi:N-acetyl-gamma-glutamyl-phosphate reductase